MSGKDVSIKDTIRSIIEHKQVLSFYSNIIFCSCFRNDTAYETLKEFKRDLDKAKQALLGAIVVTRYNNDKTYRIDDIIYKESPLSG